jgi:hypothetical protein
MKDEGEQKFEREHAGTGEREKKGKGRERRYMAKPMCPLSRHNLEHWRKF